MSIADRSILSCWGVNGGRAGQPFVVEIEGREMEGLVDDSPVRAGEIIRVRTTGGGGWGSPLDRDPALVAADVRDGKVSAGGARDDYGVVLYGDPDDLRVDSEATEARRAGLRALLPADPAARPFFDRGPGFPTLSGGLPYAEVDLR